MIILQASLDGNFLGSERPACWMALEQRSFHFFPVCQTEGPTFQLNLVSAKGDSFCQRPVCCARPREKISFHMMMAHMRNDRRVIYDVATLDATTRIPCRAIPDKSKMVGFFENPTA